MECAYQQLDEEREAREEERARAEKAESDGRLLAKMLDDQNEKLHKAEARIAELENDSTTAKENLLIALENLETTNATLLAIRQNREREADP